MDDLTSPPKSFPASLVRRLWMHGFLAGLVVVIIVYLAWLFLASPPAPREKTAVSAPGEAAPAPAPAPPPAESPVKDQLEKVLDGIRQANQQKDLALFLSLYSPTSPGLAGRAQEISKAWSLYNYPKMEFTLTDLQPLGDDRVGARVIWNITLETRSTKKVTNISKSYQVWFEKAAGQWRIQSLAKAE
jgi:hypothetical protein